MLKILGQRESHSVHVFATLQFRYPCIAKKTCQRHLPIGTSSRVRSFPLRAFIVVFFVRLTCASFHCSSLRQVTTSSQYLRPIASFGQLAICKAAILNLFIAKILNPQLVELLQLSRHNQPHSFQVINTAFIWSSSNTKNSTKFTQLPGAQRVEHTLCESPFSCTVKNCGHASSAECIDALLDRDLGIAEQGLLRKEHGVRLRDPVPQTCFTTSTIVEPCAERLHPIHHVPNISFASFTHDFNCLPWFVFCIGALRQFLSSSPSISCPGPPQR